jgi:hypothetical protein
MSMRHFQMVGTLSHHVKDMSSQCDSRNDQCDQEKHGMNRDSQADRESEQQCCGWFIEPFEYFHDASFFD